MKTEEIKKLNFGKTFIDESLKKYTSYKLNENAKMVIIPTNLEKLLDLLKYIKENNLKYKILGGGSNVIFKHDYDGIIIKLDNFNNINIMENIVEVGAGYNTIKLSMETAKKGLSGLEFASGIPGMIGGAIYNNAGAYNSDISYILEDVTVITPSLKIKKLMNKELKFNYRTSFFKESKDYIILSSTLKFKRKKFSEILDLIASRKQRRLISQPLEYPSAGSVFRNPYLDYAGRLIEEVGYKWKNINDAEVSNKHANFIINKGNATGKDIIKLINEIKKVINQKFNIDLILEQEIVN